MKATTKKFSLTPLTDNLKKDYTLVDNEIEKAGNQLQLYSRGQLWGLTKKRGVILKNVMFTLFIWPLLSVNSLRFFCGNRLKGYFSGGKDVLYDFLKRQNIDWRGYRIHIAKKVYQHHRLNLEEIRACVFDDTIKQRRGKQVAGVSRHFDHTTGTHVMGQQVLEMGLATPKAYLPLDSQIYTGEKNPQHGKWEFWDRRSAVAKDFDVALNCNKNEMLRAMLKRSQRKGFSFTHLIADAWFGNRENIKAIHDAGLTGILRVKRGNLRYVYRNKRYTLSTLYTMLQRQMARVKGTRYKAFAVNVSLDISETERIQVRLVFSAPLKADQDNWVVFLSTNPRLSIERVLSIYSLRWAIEVYFKEVKQHFGFLKEQTGDYAVHCASIHLSAIRFLIIAHITLNSAGDSFGTIRSRISKQLETITFARILWELFKALIFGALDTLQGTLSTADIALSKERIVEYIQEFLDNALQLGDQHIQIEHKAQKCGAL